MPRIAYIEWNPRGATWDIIEAANEILREYKAEGFDMTLRQLYYQFVSRGLLSSGQKHYMKLSTVMGKARMAGFVDWDYLVDRGRNMVERPHWSNPSSVISAAAHSYGIDWWSDQPFRPEVWVEKDALAGVVERPCRELDIPYFPCKGYVSLSEMWAAAYYRLRNHVRRGQTPIILHFGDHDPSGIDMTRDIEDRLSTFAEGRVIVIRCALNMDQIEEFDPPPFWAKVTDSRSGPYIAKYGTNAWELDALDPRVISKLIHTWVGEYRNQEKWEQRKRREERERQVLLRISNHYAEVADFANNLSDEEE